MRSARSRASGQLVARRVPPGFRKSTGPLDRHRQSSRHSWPYRSRSARFWGVSRLVAAARARISLHVAIMDATCDSPTACTPSARECLETPDAVVCAVCLSPVRRLDRGRCAASSRARLGVRGRQPDLPRVAWLRRCAEQRAAKQQPPARSVRDGLQPHVRTALASAPAMSLAWWAAELTARVVCSFHRECLVECRVHTEASMPCPLCRTRLPEGLTPTLTVRLRRGRSLLAQ